MWFDYGEIREKKLSVKKTYSILFVLYWKWKVLIKIPT
jgi:hypothetical protein